MRDIFRQPFNNYLLLCVASTYLAILIAMGLIIYAAKTVLHYEEEKRVGIGEAALWCISIMCMQGFMYKILLNLQFCNSNLYVNVYSRT